MSVVIVQVGQCGNQLGGALLDKLHGEAVSSSSSSFTKCCFSRFFYSSTSGGVPIANAVLVDMESKVISKVFSQYSRAWSYDPRACVSAKQGSGNNWANGYCNYGAAMEEDLMDAIRAVSDKLDSISMVLVLMSSAGGTGSGLGCKITELLKDAIPGALIVNQVVLPFSHGEVAVQSYNTLLTLSSLYLNSDSILLSHNDQYQVLARRLLPPRSKDSVSFEEMNCLISSHTAGVVLPSRKLEDEEGVLIGLDEVVQHLVPHPGYKLLALRMMPLVADHSRQFTHTSWEMLGKYCRQMLLENSILDERLVWSVKPRSELSTVHKHVSLNTSISNFVVCRGTNQELPELQDKFTVADIYQKEKVQCLFGYSSQRFEGLDKTMFVLSNAKRNGEFLDKLIEDSWTRFQARAFLYQYENFGLGADWFNDSFNVLQKVEQDYRYLSC